MSMFLPYRTVGSHEYLPDRNSNSHQAVSNSPFVSILEFVSEIYEVSVVCQRSRLYLGDNSLSIVTL